MFDQRNLEMAMKLYNQSTDFVLWKDLSSNYMMMNDQYAKLVGFRSSKSSFDHLTDHDIPCKAAEIADKFIDTDRRVIETNQTITSIEFCCYTNGEWRMHYDRKSPLLDYDGKVIGVTCYAIDVTECPIMRSALALLTMGNNKLGPHVLKQNSYKIQASFDSLGLTSRQSEVLFYMIRGKTAKEISKFLDIRHKTVEKHQEALRLKMDCNTKSELIEKAIANGVGLVLPLSVLKVQVPHASGLLTS